MALQQHTGSVHTHTRSFGRNTGGTGGLPVAAEHAYPGLNVGAKHAQTPQRGQRRQQESQGEGLQGRPGRHVGHTHPQQLLE